MKMLLRVVPGIMIIGSLMFVVVACGAPEKTTSTTERQSPPPPPAKPQPTMTQSQQDSGSGEGSSEGGTKVTVTNQDVGGSGSYAFNPSILKFKVGEKVTFTLKAETEFHTFTVEELGIDASVGAGESETLNFTFDRAGEFKLICLAHPQMTGTITVD